MLGEEVGVQFLKFLSSILTRFCAVFPAGITLCNSIPAGITLCNNIPAGITLYNSIPAGITLCNSIPKLVASPIFIHNSYHYKKPHIQRVTLFFLTVNPAQRETDHSPSSSTEVKISGDISPLPLYD